MNKKGFLQIILGIICAIVVFFAVYIPIKSCDKFNPKSSFDDDYAFPDDSFAPDEDY